MKLHFFVNHFPPLGIGRNDGVSKAVHGLACAMLSLGAEVTVLCETDHTGRLRSPDGYTIRCFARPWASPLSISRELRHYVEHNAQDALFILNGIFNRRCYAVSRALKRRGTPYVFAPHDPYHPSLFANKTLFKEAYWRCFERRQLQEACAVQILSPHHEDWLRQRGVATRVLIAPNGFHLHEVPPESRLRWSLDSPPRLLFLGRMDSHNKGLDLLLHAFAAAPELGDAVLTLQGPACGENPRLTALAHRLGITQRVRFLPADFDKDSTDILLEHDVLCLPSRFEGFGLAALEAMLAARVVLVSDVSGIASHVHASAAGVIVHPNVPSIRQGLDRLISQRKDWRAMGLRGRQHAMAHLRWDRIAANLLAQYRRILADAC